MQDHRTTPSLAAASQSLRIKLLSVRDALALVWPFVLLAITLLVLAFWWLKPMPPQTVRLATGPEHSAYDVFGQQYAQELAKNGIRVQLIPTQGSSDNLAMLQAGQADIGFVQGGSKPPSQDSDPQAQSLQSIGSLFVEPVWLFYHPKLLKRTITQLTDLKGLRVNAGTEGSGAPSLLKQLLEANRINANDLTLTYQDITPATVAFLNHEVDVLMFISAPEASMVQMLLQTPDVALVSLPQTQAYARRFAFLSPATLPRGVVDLAADNPPEDRHLIATTTTLLAHPDTHPALVQLFSQASSRLHSNAGWFAQARQFPNAQQLEFELSAEAERNLRQGTPLLQRYLPFWLANVIERMWLVLGLIIAVVLPLSRVVPPLYTLRVRSRVFRWYGQLRDIEQRAQQADADINDLSQALDELDRKASAVNLPLSYTDELYALRSNIQLVRQRLEPSAGGR